MWWLTLIDGPLPIGDIIYGAGYVVCGIIDFVGTIGVDNTARIIADGSDAVKQIINQSSSAASNPPPGDPDWGDGFETFSALKRYLGPAGSGKEWHHIVEQCQIGKSGFSATSIQNTKNVISISSSLHREISAYYSSIQPFTNGLRVRDWLAGQSFEFQYNFGYDILRKFGAL